MHAIPLSDARHLIARALVGRGQIARGLGKIVLRGHQQAAALRLAEIIERSGGALLAEPVGVGKTYTALAVAATFGGDLLIVAPASLRAMWQEALVACGMPGELITHEALSRGARPSRQPTLILADEAHRFRAAATCRYGVIADLCRKAKVLLVSATPVQNRRQDLATLLALFLGRRSAQLTDEQLAAYVVRGISEAGDEMPRVIGPRRITIEPVDDCLDDLLALPSPVPAKDESLPAALLTIGLLHQWSSSRAALVAALKRRRGRALAMLSALESGARPTRSELSAWTYASDALQLAFPALVVANNTTEFDAAELRVALESHHGATGELLRKLQRLPDPDDARAGWLRDLRRAHRDERIIAFCHYEETVNALWARLSHDPGVASLTARGARVAGGPIPRDIVLRQFAPGERKEARASERIQLLLATDLLSEGLNLQEASVVVHLDYPWNPARLDQRVGRVRRIGSHHEAVTVYAIAPPAPVEALVRIEQRLAAKLRLANRTIGVAGHILPDWIGASLGEQGLADAGGVLHRLLATWTSNTEPEPADDRSPAIAAVRHEADGFLALVADPTSPLLVADLGNGPTTSPDALLTAARAASGDERSPDLVRVDAALRRLGAWLTHRRAAASIDFSAALSSRSRRLALSRVAHALARAPRHRRNLLAPLAAAARAVATAPLAEGAERVLDRLVASELPDEAWLRSVAAFGELNARKPAPVSSGFEANAVVSAIILLQRD